MKSIVILALVFASALIVDRPVMAGVFGGPDNYDECISER